MPSVNPAEVLRRSKLLVQCYERGDLTMEELVGALVLVFFSDFRLGEQEEPVWSRADLFSLVLPTIPAAALGFLADVIEYLLQVWQRELPSSAASPAADVHELDYVHRNRARLVQVAMEILPLLRNWAGWPQRQRCPDIAARVSELFYVPARTLID